MKNQYPFAIYAGNHQVRAFKNKHPELYAEKIEPLLPGHSKRRFKATKLAKIIAENQLGAIFGKKPKRQKPPVDSNINYALQLAYSKSLVSCRLSVHLSRDNTPDLSRILIDLEKRIPKLAKDFLRKLDEEGELINSRQRDYIYYESISNHLMIRKYDWVVDPDRRTKNHYLTSESLTLHEHSKCGEITQRIQDFYLYFQSYIGVKHPESRKLIKSCEKIFIQLELLKGYGTLRMAADCPELQQNDIHLTYDRRRLRKDYLFTGLELFDASSCMNLIERYLQLSHEEAV